MFDTHCHLNFKAFEGRVEEVIIDAKKAGVSLIVIPGTDIESSQKAVQIAEKSAGIYAAVGIHPHHVYENVKSKMLNVKTDMEEIEKLLVSKKVVAIGEVGLDRHYYNKTKYPDYAIDDSFMALQKEFLKEQINLALSYNKSIIFHNREAKEDFLEVLNNNWDKKLEGKVVFHCCEPDAVLLDFAKRHDVFIGVDGDITFRKDKQDFIKTIPLEQLVLETDSPFLLPLQLRPEKGKRPNNEPKNIKLIAAFIAGIVGIRAERLEKITEANSRRLFKLG